MSSKCHVEGRPPIDSQATQVTEANSPETDAHTRLMVVSPGRPPAEAFVADDDSVDVLRFIPTGLSAELAFHDLALKKREGTLDAHHAQYLTIKGFRQPSNSEGYDPASSEGDCSPSSSTAAIRENPIYHGYFRINFRCKTTTAGAKWIVGRGSARKGPTRNVDLLLAAPDSESRKGLAAVHVFLSLHPTSGAWMIRAGQVCKDNESKDNVPMVLDPEGFKECTHSPVCCEGQLLKHSGLQCIRLPTTNLKLGGMHFEVKICVDTTAKEQQYVLDRNLWLAERGVALPRTQISCLPFESDTRTPFAVFRHGLGSGSFGTVFEGFEPQIGDLRAIKRILLRSERERQAVMDEVQLSLELAQSPGIVKTYGWCNSHGEQSIFFVDLPFDIYLVQEKGVSFKDYRWLNDKNVNWTARQRLCKQLLEGLQVIHGRGWMHRDITPGNILLFPSEPPHAALCDFGKMCRTPTETATGLAAWTMLPPKIQPGKDDVYNQKVDIWLLGLSLILAWLPEVRRGLDPRRPEDHRSMITALENRADSRLPNLIAQMVAWKPINRPTAAIALTHPCIREVTEEVTRSSKLGDKERPAS